MERDIVAAETAREFMPGPLIIIAHEDQEWLELIPV
jgi:hypothetical protein